LYSEGKCQNQHFKEEREPEQFAKRKNGHQTIAQYFGFQSQGKEQRPPQTIEDLIIQKSAILPEKERV
jgi:hypothetical protein